MSLSVEIPRGRVFVAVGTSADVTRRSRPLVRRSLPHVGRRRPPAVPPGRPPGALISGGRSHERVIVPTGGVPSLWGERRGDERRADSEAGTGRGEEEGQGRRGGREIGRASCRER